MPASSPSHCPQCGAAIPEGAEHGLCPRCVFAKALHPTVNVEASLPVPPDLDTVRRAFPHLEIIQLIGSGGMGAVFKARQPQLDRFVALKILPVELADQPGFSERFQHEAKALAKLSHPHIVTVHDYGQADRFYYLLMEFVDGVNLRQLLQTKRLTPKEALSIVPPVCDALQCAHDHGIVHRDIKPENLLIDKNGVVKIADFGIAKMYGVPREARMSQNASRQAATTWLLGTPDYAAPEQQNGQADHRADIYSLGVVLYEMLTGERPGDRIEAPSKRVQVDIRIDEIVLRALEKAPELRFATAAEFRTQVELLGQSSSSTTSTGRIFRWGGGMVLMAGVALWVGTTFLNEAIDDFELTSGARAYRLEINRAVQEWSEARKLATEAAHRREVARKAGKGRDELEELTREAAKRQTQDVHAEWRLNQAVALKQMGEHQRIASFHFMASWIIAVGMILIFRGVWSGRSTARARVALIVLIVLLLFGPSVISSGLAIFRLNQRSAAGPSRLAKEKEQHAIEAGALAYSRTAPSSGPSLSKDETIVCRYSLGSANHEDTTALTDEDMRDLREQIQKLAQGVEVFLEENERRLVVKATPDQMKHIDALIESMKRKHNRHP